MKKKITSNDNEIAKKKLLQGQKKKGNMSEFFGALKRGYDGLEYQKKVRSEWDNRLIHRDEVDGA